MFLYWNAGLASVVGANKQVWRRGKGEFGASNEEATSSEMKGNMRRRNRRIGNECNEYFLEGGGRGLSVTDVFNEGEGLTSREDNASKSLGRMGTGALEAQLCQIEEGRWKERKKGKGKEEEARKERKKG